jgi:hypothetical protein
MKAYSVFLGAALILQSGQKPEPFTTLPSEHMTNTIAEPFETRSVRGTIVRKQGDLGPLEDVIFEVRGSGTNGKIRRVVTDDHGRFRIDLLPDGLYDFKASLNGFQCVVGQIVVSKKAPRKNRITIEMYVGV